MAAAIASDVTTRNKAIVSALCSHHSVNPERIIPETIEGKDVMSLLSSFMQSFNLVIAPNNQEEVMKWVKFAHDFPSEADICHATLKGFNEDLSSRAVVLGDGLKPSEADILVFSALHHFVSSLKKIDRQKYQHVLRWMDYIQNKEDFGGALQRIEIEKTGFESFSSKSTDKLDGATTSKKATQVARSVDNNKKVVKDKNDENERKDSSKNIVSGEPTKNNKVSEEKKQPAQKEPSEKESESDISILNIQVGLIRRAWKHPSADSLLVEEIDIGDGNLRQVVSGLAKYCSPDDLSNRHVVLITNVKPGKLRDVMSSGLVLCASNQDHTIVEPLSPPEGAKLGERILFSGYNGKPEDVLNPKKKQLEKITPHLYTDDKGVATYKGVPFMTSAGPCTSSIPKASIK